MTGKVYTGGYFHAQDSRDLLDIIDRIKTLKRNAVKPICLQISDSGYGDVIRRCLCFVVDSGSIIPEGFEPIDIVDLEPVFQLVKGIALAQDKQSIYRELKPVGEGSYARVFFYSDPTYNFPVILKRARPELDDKEIRTI